MKFLPDAIKVINNIQESQFFFFGKSLTDISGRKHNFITDFVNKVRWQFSVTV